MFFFSKFERKQKENNYQFITMKTINLWISFFTSLKNKKNASKLIGKWKMFTQEDDFFTETRPSETYEFKEDGRFIHVFYEKKDTRSYSKNYTLGNWKHIQQLDFSCTAENNNILDLLLKDEGDSFIMKGAIGTKFRRIF